MDYYSSLFASKLNGGGGSGVTVEPLSVTENGTYTAPEGKAYSPVTVNVPSSDTNLEDLEIYIADFIALQPIILDGSLNGYTRQIVS